jgi:drug/metabolite transporter (DMT)-like permease
MKQIRSYFSVSVGLAGSGTVTGLVLLMLSGLFGESLIPTSLSGWLPLLGLALISHIGGQSLITYALAYLPASSASICYLMQPVVAAVLAWVILQEPLGAWQAVGGAIVLGGITLAQRSRHLS